MRKEFDDQPEKVLWKQYRQTKNGEIREYLTTKYAPLVKYVVARLSKQFSNSKGIEFDDLVSFGVFGLLDAIEKFDCDKQVQFKTYAISRIRGAVLDELRSLDWVPRSVRQKAKDLEQVIQHEEARLGRSPNEQELADAMNVSLKDLQETLMKVSKTNQLSIQDFYQDQKSTIESKLEAPLSNNPAYDVEKQDLQKQLTQFLQLLPENEKKVLILYYYEELTLKEIGKILGVTESRISQLHTKGVMSLRGKLQNRRMLD